ncbi:cholinesterase-like [Amphiura filiformis]|uniref:cholinesterase-like n=1 Tax=Amphiura filiformis TaxID=82378 RepID=UPI003B21A739
MSFIKSREDRLPAAASLNRDLAKIETWAKTWNVLFGAAKCKTTTISNRRDADGNHPPLHFFGVTLEEAESVDLLGLTLNNNLSWNQVVTKMSKTAGDPTVTVEQGQITGTRYQFQANGVNHEVDAYLGIPYAEAPVGPLRFKPPVPKEWKGELTAQKYGKICPQMIFPVFFPFKIEDMDEDCLVLNVFVPKSKHSNAAVMFWIHGGGYNIGAGSFSEGMDLHPLAALGDVIVVSINYRLNVFGFLATGDDVVPGNMGMLDQVEAMKWVQKNIAAFGGNPDRVTIFGESAGGGSVSLHTLSPLSAGLFSRAIMQSGVAIAPWARNIDTANHAKRAFTLGKLVGCNEETTEQLVDQCLRNAPVDDIINATTSLQRGALELVYFDDSIVSNPDCNYIDALSKLLGDYYFACSNDVYLRGAFEANNVGSVYAYYFNHHPSQSIFLNAPWSGASHGDDLTFFGYHFLPNNKTLTEVEVNMTIRMIQYWTNFAKTGNPNIASESEEYSGEDKEIDWPQYTPDKKMYQELVPDMRSIPDPNRARCRVWNEYIPKLEAWMGNLAECEQHRTCSKVSEERQKSTFNEGVEIP